MRVIISFAKEFLGAYFDLEIPDRFGNSENTQLFGHRILLKCSSDSLVVCAFGKIGSLLGVCISPTLSGGPSTAGLGAFFMCC